MIARLLVSHKRKNHSSTIAILGSCCGVVLLILFFVSCNQKTPSQTALLPSTTPLVTLNQEQLTTADLEALDWLPTDMLMCAQNEPWLRDKRELLETITLLAQKAEQEGIDQRTAVQARLANAERMTLASAYLCEYLAQQSQTPTEAEMQEYYARNADQFTNPPRFHIQQILIAVSKGADETLWIDAYAKCEALKERIDRGEEFDLLARQYSDGPEAVSNGDLGYITKSMITDEIASQLEPLQPNQCTEPIKSAFGYHLIKLIDHIPEEALPYDSVRITIQQMLTQQYMRDAHRKLISELKAQAKR